MKRDQATQERLRALADATQTQLQRCCRRFDQELMFDGLAAGRIVPRMLDDECHGGRPSVTDMAALAKWQRDASIWRVANDYSMAFHSIYGQLLGLEAKGGAA